MARIPTGNFGNVIAEGARAADKSQIWRGVQQFAQSAEQAQQRYIEVRQTEARSKAANEVLDHELQVKTKADEIADKVSAGEIAPDDAGPEFDKAVGQYKAPRIDYLDPVAAEGLDRGRKRTVEGARARLSAVADVARRRDGQARFSSALDTLGKLAGLPDANIEEINGRAELLREQGRQAAIPEDQITRALQNFKDSNWFNQANQRAMDNRNSLDGLKALTKDLTAKDGFYAGKLDTDKRNALLRSVQADQDRLINRAETLALRNEAKADRVLAEIDRQIASGVPATAQMWADWGTKVAGTPQAAEFNERVKTEKQVQEVLRLPVDQQAAYVQQQEAALLKGGGTLQQAANVQRLREAVKRNVTLLQEAPLLFNDNRTGGDTQPIDFGAIGTEEGAAAMRAQLHDRVLTLDAMRKQYGGQVQTRPLLPQEAQLLTSALESSSPQQTAQVFAQLRDAVGDDEMFFGIMHQIAPDSPVKAEAGVLAAKQRSMTLERNWIADDVMASSRDVSATILEGDAILNRSKAAGKSDGKPDKGLFMPADQDLQRRFASEVGAAFAGRPGAADLAFQVVKSYYAGKAAQTGRIAANPQDVDSGIVKEAIKASLGTVVDYNARGEVLAPWGMSEDEFDDGVHKALQVAAGQVADPAAFRDRVSLLGLAQRTESTYYLRTERGFVTDSKGQPIVIDVLNPTKALRTGEVKR